jgi:hypothetical protein
MLEALHLIISTDHKPRHLRLPSEAGQMLTGATQPHWFCSRIHARHMIYTWIEQRRRTTGHMTGLRWLSFRLKGSHQITWTLDFHRAFKVCKASLSVAILMSQSDPPVVQQCASAGIPLHSSPTSWNPAQQKCSAYDRKLLAVYEAEKHLRLPSEAGQMLTASVNHLDFVAQLTTNKRHISGQDNFVADVLSRFESVTAPASQHLAASHVSDDRTQSQGLSSNHMTPDLHKAFEGSKTSCHSPTAPRSCCAAGTCRQRLAAPCIFSRTRSTPAGQKCSPQLFSHMDFVAEFTAGIWYTWTRRRPRRSLSRPTTMTDLQTQELLTNHTYAGSP